MADTVEDHKLYFDALVQFCKDEQLDLLANYFKTHWELEADKKPETWALCFRSGDAFAELNGSARVNMTAESFFGAVSSLSVEY
jgi:hypothetical protein